MHIYNSLLSKCAVARSRRSYGSMLLKNTCGHFRSLTRAARHVLHCYHWPLPFIDRTCSSYWSELVTSPAVSQRLIGVEPDQLRWCLTSPQVNAAVGCLARMPLPHDAFRPIHHTSQPAAASSQPQQTLDRTSSRFASELWAPYLRDTALRVFGSVGVTGQLGHFCRPVLDFTAGQHCTCLSSMSPAWLVACCRHGCYVMTVLQQALDHFVITCFQLISLRGPCTYLQALPINIFGLCNECCYNFDQCPHGMTWSMILCQAVQCHCSAAGTIALSHSLENRNISHGVPCVHGAHSCAQFDCQYVATILSQCACKRLCNKTIGTKLLMWHTKLA